MYRELLMIEQRRLTKEELNRLIDEAPDTETRNLKRIMNNLGLEPFDFFDKHALDHFGLISEGRPIYVAVLVNSKGKNEFWTVVNSKVKDIISLCKFCKREIKIWIDKYKEIYATMEDVTPENQKWTKWLGFKELNREGNLITYKKEVTKRLKCCTVQKKS